MPGSFQWACFDHEAEVLELGEIVQGGAFSDSGHFLRPGSPFKINYATQLVFSPATCVRIFLE